MARAEIPQRTLKRRFKNATGTTPIDYLQNQRIEEAKRLLEATRTPVEEIGIMVGYDDASFFRRLFKRKTGLTAGAYRRMFQAVPAGNTGDGFARTYQAPGSPQAESARMP